MILQKKCRMGDLDMLLEFRTKNYKSFAEDAIFCMVAAPKQKGLDYSLCTEKIKGKNVKEPEQTILIVYIAIITLNLCSS